MKTTIYLIFALMIIFLSCRKPNNNNNNNNNNTVCNHSLMAFKKCSNDSYMLIEVDTLTGRSSVNSFYPCVRKANGCYLAKDNCYYSLQSDSLGGLKLYKFDLKNKTTDILLYTGSPRITTDAFRFYLVYNNVYDKLYYLESYVNGASYSWEFYEIIISGNTFSDRTITPLPSPDGIFSPILLDEHSGDMYFYSRDRFNKYIPSTNKVLPTTLFKNHSHFLLQYSKRDSMFYDFKYPEFFKIDHRTEVVTAITNLSPTITNGYTNSTFDACKNQYILQSGGYPSDSNINLFWLDVKTGKVMKHLNTYDSYIVYFVAMLHHKN